jgi:hypothetical protein
VAYLSVEIDEHKDILTKMSKILVNLKKLVKALPNTWRVGNEKTFFGLGSRAWRLPALPAELARLPSLVAIGACRHDVACCCLNIRPNRLPWAALTDMPSHGRRKQLTGEVQKRTDLPRWPQHKSGLYRSSVLFRNKSLKILVDVATLRLSFRLRSAG